MGFPSSSSSMFVLVSREVWILGSKGICKSQTFPLRCHTWLTFFGSLVTIGNIVQHFLGDYGSSSVVVLLHVEVLGIVVKSQQGIFMRQPHDILFGGRFRGLKSASVFVSDSENVSHRAYSK
jgi:hypothetical protein